MNTPWRVAIHLMNLNQENIAMPEDQTIKFFDFEMRLDCKSGHDREFWRIYNAHGIYEADVTNIIRNELKKGDTFVDVGANNGYYSLMASNLVGKRGNVYSFEPAEKSFERLRRNIELNGFGNIYPYMLALGNKRGKAVMYNAIEDGSNSLSKIPSSTGTEIVMTNTLDTILKNNKVLLIKIDVEGHELEVLEGAEKVLHKNKDIKLILEYILPLVYRFNRDYDGVFRFLTSRNFNIREITGVGKFGKRITSYKQLSDWGCNLYCER